MLPVLLTPPPPFPLVIAQSSVRTQIAPGATVETYYLMTSSGPLVVRALDINLRKPALRISAVLAHDTLLSGGETVSAMASRTGAIAGINADYFDIGQTNQPLNIVVRDGMLLRTPSGRATISLLRDRTVRFGTYRFSATVFDAERTWQLQGVNEWPPQGAGAMLVTPVYGVPLAAVQGITYVRLAPAQLDPNAGATSGTYHVERSDNDAPSCARCTMLAFGVRAASNGTLPVPGDEVRIAAATDPSLGGVATAVGGGPLLVKGGAPYEDPDPPSPAEALQHDPQSGALTLSDGTLAFIDVDGRDRARSIGLTRPELGALMRGLGAHDGMAFDSGGSATLVARVPGDPAASLLSTPSDGRERNVADGLFLYSSDPLGRATHLAIRPDPLVMLAGAHALIDAIPLDAAGHPIQDGSNRTTRPPSLSVAPAALARLEPGGRLVAIAPGSGLLRVRSGALVEDVPLRVVAGLAALRVEPPDPNPAPSATVDFKSVGLERSNAPVLIDGAVRWSTTTGSIASDGRYHAASRDAIVSARAGGRVAQADVRVGRSELVLMNFAAGRRWTFSTYPAGGRGTVTTSAERGESVLELSYDFSGDVRGAYANTALFLQGAPLAMSIEVRGDGAGVGVRAAFTNADGDRVAVTLARRADWQGYRRCEVSLPATAAPPLTLRALYVVPSLGTGRPARASGAVAFRDLRFEVAGSAGARS